MKIETQPLENRQVRLIVEVEESQILIGERRAARKLSQKMKIPGFRPGKAPYNVVQKMIGAEELRREGIYDLVDEIYPQVIKEAGIKPYSAGELEEIKDEVGQPVVLAFKIPLKAEVTLGNYHAIRIPFEQKNVEDQDIDAELVKLQEKEAVFEPADRPIIEGDNVEIQLTIRRVKPVEGKEDILVNERHSPIVVKAEGENETEWPYAGFSRELIGHVVGQEKVILYTYPDGAPIDTLRGLDVQLHILIERISVRTLPVIDDEFAKSIGEYQNLEELKKSISEDLSDENERTAKEDYNEKIVEELLKVSEVSYPDQMVDDQIDASIERLESRLKSQGLSLDTYLKLLQKDMDGLKTEMREDAEQRIKSELILYKVAEVEDIQVNVEEAQSEAKEEITRLINSGSVGNVSPEQLINYVLNNIIAEKLLVGVWDCLHQIAKGEYQAKPAEGNIDSSSVDSLENVA